MPLNSITEEFIAEQEYELGTIVDFAGSHEVRITLTEYSSRVAGVITSDTNNSLNEEAFITPTDGTVVTMVIAGRAMCKVKGVIGKGDLLVSSNEKGVACRLDPQKYTPGCILGKSLENNDQSDIRLVQIIVGTVT